MQQPTKLIIAVVVLASGLTAGCASTQLPESRDIPPSQTLSGGTAGHKAAAVALQQLGVPYQYGGRSPRGFDCSGLVQYSYQRIGKQLPRTTRQLWSALPPVSREELQIGDVLFFNVDGKLSHVGVYIGDERFVHAPSSGRNVSIASLDSGFYETALIRAGRPR